MTSFLPLQEPRLPQQQPFFSGLLRNLKLRWDRRLYQYDYTHVSPLAVMKNVPILDEFGFEWLKVVGRRVLESLENRAELELEPHHASHHTDKHSLIRQLFEIGEGSILSIKHHISEALRFDGRTNAPAISAKSLEDYANLFRAFGLPPIAKDFMDDRAFARMRTSGPNPVMLKRLKALDERMPITNEMFRIASPLDSLEAALAEGRLYLADYAQLDGAELGNFPNGQKYLYAPLALFVISGPKKELLPVAIQCQQKPAPDNPIMTPDDGYNWQIAKTIVDTADSNVHEASTHLGRTHLAMEAFVVSSYRQLAKNHPLARLLWPHFEGTLAINKAAWQHLIAEKGAVDKLMGGSIKTSRQVAVQGVQSIRVMRDLLPLTFEQRGVDDREAFPNYPYRDDALLYWDAIHEWVNAYLRLYYPNDTEIQRDTELQAWSRELASDNGGRIKGLPNDGAIQRIEELIDVTTFVIYTCSVQHAAVNFPQYDCMSYAPNMPCAGYRPAPTSKTGATEADFVAMLPTLDMAELQMELGYMLGTVHYTELGQYGTHHFHDQRVSAPLQQFQKRLAEIGQKIGERNQTRRAYDTLAPSGIPQSINI
ncbi:MAG: lox 1 [Planctomycetaceae bacterium]|nr:lox 1 [Planctomycetaceae bacterium]